MAKQIRIDIPNVTGNIVITAIAEIIASGEGQLYVTDLQGNRLLDSLGNYLMCSDTEYEDTSNYVIDSEGYYVLDKEQYQLTYKNDE